MAHKPYYKIFMFTEKAITLQCQKKNKGYDFNHKPNLDDRSLTMITHLFFAE